MNPEQQQQQPSPQPQAVTNAFQSSAAQYQQQAVGQQPAPTGGSLLPHKQSKLPLILAVVFGMLFVVATVFGLWAYTEMLNYRDNSDEISAQAVAAALDVQKEELSKDFAEQAKEPFLTYTGPSTYGSVTFEYPRTWSVYTVEESSSNLLNVYMHPGGIADVEERGNIQAFIFQVREDVLEEVVDEIESDVEEGIVKSNVYRLPKVPDAVGSKADGQLDENINGSRVYLPIRDRTLIFTTEATDYLADFDRILSTITFTP